MMLMSPPVKLEDKPSVTSDSNGAGSSDIKGDSLCSLHKSGTRSTTHDFKPGWSQCLHRSGSTDLKGRTMDMNL